MEPNVTQLRTALMSALTILQQDTQALEARVQATQALLLAALLHDEHVAASDTTPLDVSGITAPVDPSTAHLRDQLAVTLGLEWQVIAPFLPPPSPGPVALPPRSGATSPAKPWYLVDAQTTQMIAGPSTDPLPANALYLTNPVATVEADLVVLCDSEYREDDQLPQVWCNIDERGTSDSEDEPDEDYDDPAVLEDDGAADRLAELDELVRVYGYAHCV